MSSFDLNFTSDAVSSPMSDMFKEYMDHPVTKIVLGAFLAAYGGAAFSPPDSVNTLISSRPGKFLVIFVAMWGVTSNVMVSAIAALSMIVVHELLVQIKEDDMLVDWLGRMRLQQPIKISGDQDAPVVDKKVLDELATEVDEPPSAVAVQEGLRRRR